MLQEPPTWGDMKKGKGTLTYSLKEVENMEEFVGLCTKLVGDRVWVGNLRIIKETKKGN